MARTQYIFIDQVPNKSLPGKPDIVLPKYRTVIFVHGCRAETLIWSYHTQDSVCQSPEE